MTMRMIGCAVSLAPGFARSQRRKPRSSGALAALGLGLIALGALVVG
jgi:hypothetical protein